MTIGLIVYATALHATQLTLYPTSRTFITYDLIVAGVGTHGSATLAEAARRGARVLGIERFLRGHEMGSFVGRTRIIRTTYFEHPGYVPLLRRAWTRWEDLERESGEQLLVRTGGLYLGKPGSRILAGLHRSIMAHGLSPEYLDATALRRDHPWFRSDGEVAIYETQAGYLRAELAIAAHLQIAERHGAETRFGDGAVSWDSDDSRTILVRTASGATFRTRALVLTLGAWITRLLPELSLPVVVERIPLFWFEPPRTEVLARIPIFIAEIGETDYYGFPYLPDEGFKVARMATGHSVDPDEIVREVGPREDEAVTQFVRERIPAGAGYIRAAKACMYTNTPDRQFIVDRHPHHDNVVFASACSGHGFKFASVIGEVLSDLAFEGRTRHDISFLSLDRFQAARPA